MLGFCVRVRALFEKTRKRKKSFFFHRPLNHAAFNTQLPKVSTSKSPTSNINNTCTGTANISIATHTHTHNRFTALLEYVRDHPGEQVPER